MLFVEELTKENNAVQYISFKSVFVMDIPSLI